MGGRVDPVHPEGAEIQPWWRPYGKVRQQLAEERAELEAVAAGAASDDDVADPIEHEVGIDRVVVDAALRRHRFGVETGQKPADRVGQPVQVRRVVVVEERRRCRRGVVVVQRAARACGATP